MTPSTQQAPPLCSTPPSIRALHDGCNVIIIVVITSVYHAVNVAWCARLKYSYTQTNKNKDSTVWLSVHSTAERCFQ